MVVRTTMVELTLPVESLKDPVKQEGLRQDLKARLAELKLMPVDGPLSVVDANGCMRLFFSGENNNYAVVQTNPKGLLTIDITENVPDGGTSLLTHEVISDLAANLQETTGGSRPKCLPAVRRGEVVQRYFPSAENLFIEYDFDRCVFEADTPYQNVKIMHSRQFGNTLLLDDDPNLAESDLAYTHAITGHGREDYRGKTVLILGGGDGGILHEILKQQPAFITMVDIDAVVVEAAAKYLRGICYDSLDKLSGDNYEVLIADCVPVLQEYYRQGKIFDFVINDLTAIPCTTEPIGNHWDFLRLILNLSMQVLSPTGKYYTQGNSFNLPSSLAMYELQLQKLITPVDFKKHNVCVPSYHEMWVFYEIWKKPSPPVQ